jgi:hypothetical protein
MDSRLRSAPPSVLIGNSRAANQLRGKAFCKLPKSTRRFANWPDPDPRRKAQGRSKMFDGAVPQVLKTQQRFIGRFADFADCLQARRR